MKEIKGTTLDKTELNQFIPIPEDVYFPAHVESLNFTETKSGILVFNLTFKISDAVEKQHMTKYEMKSDGTLEAILEDGNPVQVSCAFMKGKIYRSVGLFLTPNPPEGKGWRNRRYLEFFEGMGIKFQRLEDGKIKLGLVEESDVIGLPVMILMKTVSYRAKDGSTKRALNVVKAKKWEDGQRLSTVELRDGEIPF